MKRWKPLANACTSYRFSLNAGIGLVFWLFRYCFYMRCLIIDGLRIQQHSPGPDTEEFSPTHCYKCSSDITQFRHSRQEKLPTNIYQALDQDTIKDIGTIPSIPWWWLPCNAGQQWTARKIYSGYPSLWRLHAAIQHINPGSHPRPFCLRWTVGGDVWELSMGTASQ